MLLFALEMSCWRSRCWEMTRILLCSSTSQVLTRGVGQGQQITFSMSRVFGPAYRGLLNFGAGGSSSRKGAQTVVQAGAGLL